LSYINVIAVRVTTIFFNLGSVNGRQQPVFGVKYPEMQIIPKFAIGGYS
jgi:hypothetical protein